MSDTQEVIEKHQWEGYAQENLERQAKPTKTEIELWHDGSAEFYYSKIRKVGSFFQEKTGMVAETWEALTDKDMPPKFTVLLHKGTLESHLYLCKFRETVYGASLIQKITLISVLLLYIPLLGSLGGLLPSDLDLLQWYWVAPISLVTGIFIMLAWYNKVAVCARLVLECAMPEVERGNHHVCYICHSKAGNVVQQLNAWDRNAQWMQSLVDGLVQNLSNRVRDLENYNLQLEYEADQRDQNTVHRVTRHYNRAMKLGPEGMAGGHGILLLVGLTALGILGGALAMYFFASGG